MAWELNGVVEPMDLINQFIGRIQSAILSGDIVSQENPNEYIPYAYLGSIHEFDIDPNAVGATGHIIRGPGQTLGSVYGALTYLTKLLLKVGTWSYHSGMEGNPSTEKQFSGRCIFSNDAVLSCFKVPTMYDLPINPDGSKVAADVPIKFTSVDELLTNCLNSLMNSSSVNYTSEDVCCHVNCHTNQMVTTPCHINFRPSWVDEDVYNSALANASTNPTDKDNCYANGSWVYGKLSDYHINDPGSTRHQDEGETKDACHTNHSMLSLINNYGGCNTPS